MTGLAGGACVPDAEQRSRLRAFLAANPEWSVGYDHSVGVWRAFRDWPGGFELHCRYQVDDLLDHLETVLAAEPGIRP
jgi:hypothetical protein